MIVKDPAVRAWIYGIFVAAAAVAVIYGLVTGEEAAAWLAVVSAVLGNSLALANVDKTGRHEA